MVQGAIQKGGRSDLVIINRDKEAKRNSYIVNSILDVLKDQHGIFYKPGRIFMMDNARVYTA